MAIWIVRLRDGDRWSPDNKTLVASSAAGEVVIYREPEFDPFVLQPMQGKSIDCCVFSPDGQFLAVGGQTGQINIWRIQAKETTLVATIPDITDWVDRMAWSPTDNLLAFSRGRYIQVWDSVEGLVVTLDFETSSVLDIDWHPDGTLLSVGGYQGVKLWTVDHFDRDPYVLPIDSASLAVAWSPDGKYIASGNMDRTVMVLEWGSMDPWRMDGFPGKVSQLAWSQPANRRGSPLLAAASAESIVVWGRRGESERWDNHLLLEHGGNVRSIEFQPTTELLASAAADSQINLWSRGKDLAHKLSGAAAGFSCLAWDPKGSRLAAGGQDGELLIWAQTKLGFGRR